MKIPENLFLYINIIIGVIYLINIIEAVSKGLLYEVVKLAFNVLGIYLSYRFALLMAENYPLFNIDLGILEGLVDANGIGNTIIWFIILLVVFKILMMIILPLLKFLSKVPVLGFINRIGGLIFGLINATIIVMLLSLVLTLPVFENGEEVKNGTLIRYVSDAVDMVKEYVLNQEIVDINLDELNIKDITDMIDETAVESFDDVKEFIDELGIESVKDININDLTNSEKLKLFELYKKYAEK